MVQLAVSSQLGAFTEDYMRQVARIALEETPRFTVNSVARQTRLEAIRRAERVTDLRAKLIREGINTLTARNSIDGRRPTARVRFLRRVYSLREFDPRHTDQGISVQVLKGARPRVFRGGFSANVGQGKRQFFERTVTSRRDPRSKRGRRRTIKSGRFRGKAYYPQLPIRRLQVGIWEVWDRLRPEIVSYAEGIQGATYERELTKRFQANGIAA